MVKRRFRKLKEKSFRKTLSVFSDLLGRKLSLEVGHQVTAYTDGHTIYLPKTLPEANIKYLCYEIYVLFEHEISHLVFNTHFPDFVRYKQSKDLEEANLAGWSWNLVDDERIESCWNLIYRTPFRQNFKKLFIIPNANNRQGKKITTMEVIMDVRGGFVRNQEPVYMQTWKEIDTILNEVRGSVYARTTTRVAEKLFNYIKNKGLEIDSKCDLTKGPRNREKGSQQGKRNMGKITIDPKKLCEMTSGGCGGGFSEADYELMREMLQTYGKHFEHSNLHADGNKQPPTLCKPGGPGSGGGFDPYLEEQDKSLEYIEDLKKVLIPDYVQEKPENMVLGDIKFTTFTRGTPAAVDRSIRAMIPFKRKETRWYSDVGELDVDEYIQKRARGDRWDTDYFEDTINIRGMDIVFLCDWSGSMSSGYYWRGHDDATIRAGKEFVLKQTIYSLWKSVENIPGVNVQTILFSGDYGSTTPMEIISNPEEVLSVQPNGATHTHRALDYVHRMLERKKDRRRVVFLLTDGEPTGDAIVKNPYLYVQSVVQRMRRNRIDLFTIFIDRHPISPEKLKYFGNKTNSMWLPPDKMADFLRKEVAKLIRLHTKNF